MLEQEAWFTPEAHKKPFGPKNSRNFDLQYFDTISQNLTHSPYLVTRGGNKAETSFTKGEPELQGCKKMVDAHGGSSVGVNRNI
jgi:hypothetical protein